MKKLNFITPILLSSLVYAGVCDPRSYSSFVLDNLTPPFESGKYVAISHSKTLSYGDIGKKFSYSDWEHLPWYKAHSILCVITDVELKDKVYYQHKGDILSESCYFVSLNCLVEKRTQFITDNVKYTDLKGYRSTTGTLKWTRDKIGSTDFYCYDESGFQITKIVNDPKFCE